MIFRIAEFPPLFGTLSSYRCSHARFAHHKPTSFISSVSFSVPRYQTAVGVGTPSKTHVSTACWPARVVTDTGGFVMCGRLDSDLKRELVNGTQSDDTHAQVNNVPCGWFGDSHIYDSRYGTGAILRRQFVFSAVFSGGVRDRQSECLTNVTRLKWGNSLLTLRTLILIQ